MPYLVTYSLSYILCGLGEKCQKYKVLSNILISLAVLCVAFLAGMRDYTIGVDTESYTKWFFCNAGQFRSFTAFYDHYSDAYEVGFALWTYMISKVSDSYNVFLFLTACVIYGFSMCAIHYYRNVCSISLVWLFFIFLTCTEALNITRQYMAMAIVIWAFHYVEEKKILRYIIWTIIAISFHVSAVFSVVIIIIYFILQKKNTAVNRAIIVGGFCFLIIGYGLIVDVFSHIGFIADKLAIYTKGASYSFQLNPLLIRLPYSMLILLERSAFSRESRTNIISKKLLLADNSNSYFQINKENADFLIVLLFVEMMLCQMRGINVGFYRMTGFFYIFKFVSYSRIVSMKSSGAKPIFYLVTYAYILVIFVYWTIILKSGHIYPYTSEILNIK